MEKKAKRKANKKIPVYNETLPQNIVEVGENVEEDKRIYISQSVYKKYILSQKIKLLMKVVVC